MQELEKILEEIEDEAMHNPEVGRKQCEGMIRAMYIIRKHLSGKNTDVPTNDGWIPVEEWLPNGGIDVEVTARRGYRTIGHYNELYEEWYSADESGLIDVIAWKEPSEPYRPERNGE